jgi:hypothetical protein
MTSLKTIFRAVACDSAPLVRIVRWRTVADTLSTVGRAQVIPVFGAEIVEDERLVAVLDQAGDGLLVFGPILLGERRDRRLSDGTVRRRPDLA